MPVPGAPFPVTIQPIMNMKPMTLPGGTLKIATALSCSLLLATDAVAALVSLSFDTPAEYDNNFWLSGGEKDLVWRSPGQIQKDDEQNSSGYAIYNSGSTGGSGGSGGTSGGSELNKFVNFSIQADFQAGNVNAANGLGFFVKGSDSLDSGYVVIFRPATSTTASSNVDMRIWGPGSNAVTGNLGTPLMASTPFVSTDDITSSAWYTFRLDVEDIDGQVRFAGSVWDTATNKQVGQTIEFLHGDSPILGEGQVGIRLGSGNNAPWVAADNFLITAIPEPSSGLLLAAGTALALRRRRG